MFEANYEENIVQLWQDVKERKYEIRPSICFIITRPKKREVFAADFRDRVIHHLIMQRLEPLFESHFIQDNYNCRKNKGVLYGVKRLHQQIKECSENYTKSCYIGKFDMQGFFMSINKILLWKMLYTFIINKYKGNDIDTLLYLVKKVVLNEPQYKCIKKSKDYMWNDLSADKSLFTCANGCGLPIGNLTSQCFANFYLSYFDKLLKKQFTYYGRYVDDFYIICRDKERIVNSVRQITNYLKYNLGITLHPKKIYIQHYSKGVKFIGAVVKRDRMYVANTTVSNVYKCIHRYNNTEDGDYVAFIQSLNSYFGFLKHYCTYHIKRRICKLIDEKWDKYFVVSDDYTMFKINTNYKPQQIIRDNIINNNIF